MSVTIYDPELIDRLVREAMGHHEPFGELIAAMADQLEAARAKIEKMRLESFTEATTTLALSNSNQAKDEHIESLAAELEAARSTNAKLQAMAVEIERQRHDTAMREVNLLMVVEAAEKFREALRNEDNDCVVEHDVLIAAIDAYRDAKDKEAP